MEQWTFRNNAGTTVTVRAESEDHARTFAVTKLWGDSIPWYYGYRRWIERGLYLISHEPILP